jgi:hypothetical protein
MHHHELEDSVMTTRRPSTPAVISRAIALGLGAFLVVPVVAALGALAVGHAAGACGAGSSGGCEMGAAMLAMIVALPAFVIAAAVSVFLDLRKPKA